MNNGNQDLVIEELQSNKEKSKCRAMSIEVRVVTWRGPLLSRIRFPHSFFSSFFLLLYKCIGSGEGVGGEEAEPGSLQREGV